MPTPPFLPTRELELAYHEPCFLPPPSPAGAVDRVLRLVSRATRKALPLQEG